MLSLADDLRVFRQREGEICLSSQMRTFEQDLRPRYAPVIPGGMYEAHRAEYASGKC